MATTVTLNSVTTADAVPTTAPHKISNQSGKSTAVVNFTVGGSGAIRAWLARIASTSLTNGTEVGAEGMLCGIARCNQTPSGGGYRTSKSLARPLATAVSENVTYSEASPRADGTYVVNLYAYTDDGWAL